MTAVQSDREMKVAIFIWGLAGGAFTNLGTALARGFKSNGVDTELIVLRHPTQDELSNFSDLSIHSLGVRRAATSVPALVRHLRKTRPDILLSMPHMINVPAVAAVRLAQCGTRSIISEHNNLSFDMQITHRRSPRLRAIPWSIKTLYPLAHGLVAPSKGVFEDPLFQSAAKHCRAPRAVIPNPLTWDPTSPPSRRVEDCPHPWLASDRTMPVLLSIGRLVEQKGFDVLLRSMKDLERRGHPARLVILGEGPLRKSLETLRDELKLQNRVDFAGFSHNAMSFMSHCDAFVLASRWEGFGIVLIEAMALGKPIVATKAPGGPSEILTNRRNALVVPVEDPARLADALSEILGNPNLAKELGRNAYLRSSQYSPAAVAAEYLSFFEKARQGTHETSVTGVLPL